MSKTYILDTSAILTNPNCIYNFPKSNVVIHIDVLNELDKIKTSPSAAGKQARVFIRMMDELSSDSTIDKGIKLKNNSLLLIETKSHDASIFGDPDYTDNRILACAHSIKNCTIVSNDINLRIRARVAGINAIQCDKEKKNIDDLYSGYQTIINQRLGEQLKKDRSIECKSEKLKNVFPNECVIFQNKSGKVISIGRKKDKKIVAITNSKAWGLRSKNLEQAFVMDMLLDPDVPLVSMSGIAGTGKTLLAMACGIQSVVINKDYDKLVIYRPIQPVGTEMGYLPGSLNDKLDPWMAAVKDSIDFLTHSGSKGNNKNNGWKNNLAQYSDLIHMEALTYIRGRSISNAFILVDETQNISKDEIKTILTRAGHNTKIVLTGDIEQIDNYHLDAINNGLTYTIEQFKDSKLSGHITLTQGERSPLATLSANIL